MRAMLKRQFVLGSLEVTQQTLSCRRFPGNPLMAENEAYVRCWNNTDGTAPTHFITITDNCPCVQYSETTGNQVPHRAPAGDMCSPCAGHFRVLWVYEPGPCDCILEHEVLAAQLGQIRQELAWRQASFNLAQNWPSRAADHGPHIITELIVLFQCAV